VSDVFEKLRSAYAITLGDRLMPGVGSYGVGAVAVVHPDEGTALAWVEECSEDLESLERGPAEIIPVGDPWQFMRRAAGEGLAGIEGAETELLSLNGPRGVSIPKSTERTRPMGASTMGESIRSRSG